MGDAQQTDQNNLAGSSSSSAQLVDGLGRPVLVFTRESEMLHETASASTSSAHQDIDYEFNERDLHLVMAGYAATNAKSSQGLRTRAMREEEEKRKIASYGPVPIRIEFPDGYIMQAHFSATANLQQLASLVAAALVSPLASHFHLFTAPPKTILKDLDTTTLYSARLIPAARVYVGFEKGVEWKNHAVEIRRSASDTNIDSDSSMTSCSVLNQAALALCSAPPPKSAALHEGRDKKNDQEEEVKEEAAAPVRKVQAGAAGLKKGGVPKWMKLSK